MPHIIEEGADGCLQELKTCKSLGAVLETAMAFEKASCAFYSQLKHRVSVEVRPLVRKLAKEAQVQYRHLREMSKDERLSEHLDRCVRRPETCLQITHYAHLPHLEEDSLDDDILKYALDMEHIAFEHYGFLCEVTPGGLLRDLFAQLAHEKLGRIKQLEVRWASMFSVL